MALGPRLDLRQSQTLTMTPQLQQAIKLLALSNLEIEAYDDGVLLQIVVKEGESVPVGSPIAYVGQKGEKVEAVAPAAPAPMLGGQWEAILELS